jgi:hypothetical protein
LALISSLFFFLFAFFFALLDRAVEVLFAEDEDEGGGAQPMM